MKNDLIVLDNVTWQRGDSLILDHVSFSLKQNEHWVLLGRNGAGKTSIINILYGRLWPTSGSVKLFGETYGETIIRDIQKRIGILESGHQEHTIQKSLTVLEIICTGLFSTVGFYQEPNPEQIQLSEEILQKSNLSSKKNQRFLDLSSGEKKKVLLLRALVSSPDLLILDEPCSAFDLHAREDFFDFLKEFSDKKKFTSLYITHRPEEIPTFYTHALLLKSGRILASGPIPEVFTSEMLSDLYDLDLEVEIRNQRYLVFPSQSSGFS